uniref:restriction endonuclease subunit S n=1 Tax=Eubacterium sp. TaxID=142586 RepID=UPI0040280BD5
MNKVKLGEILKIKHGFVFKSENYVDESEYALVTLANISPTNNFQFNKDNTTFYGASFPDDFILKEDDLIMPLTEQVIGLFGNTAFVPKMQGLTFVLNQRVGKVVPVDGKADKYYLHYLLATNLVKDQLEYRASGTRQRNISPDDVYDVEVFLPDITTQKKIGKCLYDIEKKVNLNSTINDNLEQQAKLIYDYWFT